MSSHRTLVELAARHKLPTICQKPFAPTLVDAKAMVDVSDKAGVPLMIHENFRWQSPIQAVKAVLDLAKSVNPSSVASLSGQASMYSLASPIWRKASGSSSRISASTFSMSRAFSSATSRRSRPAPTGQFQDRRRGCGNYADGPCRTALPQSSIVAMRRNFGSNLSRDAGRDRRDRWHA